MRFFAIISSLFLSFSLFFCNFTHADEAPFAPVWKLLSSENKRQFVAGYLMGWNDSRKVTEIAIEYVKENPKKGLETLESIKTLYNTENINADSIAHTLDKFFMQPENEKATLSKAMSAVTQAK